MSLVAARGSEQWLNSPRHSIVLIERPGVYLLEPLLLTTNKAFASTTLVELSSGTRSRFCEG